jgi:hypothetical protein
MVLLLFTLSYYVNEVVFDPLYVCLDAEDVRERVQNKIERTIKCRHFEFWERASDVEPRVWPIIIEPYGNSGRA